MIFRKKNRKNENCNKRDKLFHEEGVDLSDVRVLLWVSASTIGMMLPVTRVVSVSVPIAGASAFITSVVTLLTIDYLDRHKKRWKKLDFFSNLIAQDNENALKNPNSTVWEIKKSVKTLNKDIFDKRNEVLISTQLKFKVGSLNWTKEKVWGKQFWKIFLK